MPTMKQSHKEAIEDIKVSVSYYEEEATEDIEVSLSNYEEEEDHCPKCRHQDTEAEEGDAKSSTANQALTSDTRRGCCWTDISRRPRITLLMLVAVLLVIIALVVIVPTTMLLPCRPGTERVKEQLYQYLADRSKGLRHGEEAQQQAYEWLISFDESHHCESRATSVTKFALATLFFSCSPETQLVFQAGSTINLDVIAEYDGTFKCKSLYMDDMTVSATGYMDDRTIPGVAASGISCDTRNNNNERQPVGLYYGIATTCSIPPEIGLLTGLEVVFVRGVVDGQIPSQIGNLEQLRHLAIFESEFRQNNCKSTSHSLGTVGTTKCHLLSGPIPSELGRLTQLTTLMLQANALTGTVPQQLGSLSLLETLRLDRNCLTGTLPTELISFSNLTTLNIRQNALLAGWGPDFPLDTIPQHWITSVDDRIQENVCDCFRDDWTCTADADYLYCPPPPPTCNRAPSGMCLHLLDDHPDCDLIDRPSNNDNTTSTSINDTINKSCLDKYQTTSSNLVQNSPEQIQAFQKILLEAFPSPFLTQPAVDREASPQQYAYNWVVTTNPLECFSPLSQIQRYVLAVLVYSTVLPLDDDAVTRRLINATISECFWEGVHCLYSGKIGRLSFTPLAGFHLPLEIGIFTSLRSLQVLSDSVWTTPQLVLPTLPSELGLLSELRDLKYFYHIYGTLPQEMGRMTSLTSLRFHELDYAHHCKLNGIIPTELGTLTSLTRLDLSCNLTGAIPSQFGQLSRLDHLAIDGNRLTGEIPTDLYYMTTLQHLFAKWNSFSSTLSPQFFQMTNLKVLSISGLSGTLPTQLGRLNRLEFLDIGRDDNKYCSQWEFCDPKGAGIAGTLPSEWGRMTELRDLHLGQLSLTGTIPTEWGQMQSLVSLSLNQNPGLTGTLPFGGAEMPHLTHVYTGFTQLPAADTAQVCRQARNYSAGTEDETCFSANCWDDWCIKH